MFFPPNFSIERTDRDYVSIGGSRGGGVALAISKKYKFIRRNDLEGQVESVWVELLLPTQKSVLLGCVYFPDHLLNTHINSFFDTLSDLIPPSSAVYLLGDFNIPHIDWNNLIYTGDRSGKKDRAIALFNLCLTLNLSQFNSVPNTSNQLLDLVLSNRSGVQVTRNDDPFVKEDAYHPCLKIYLPLTSCPREASSTNLIRRNYSAGDYVGLTNALSKLNWSDIYKTPDINNCIEMLTSRLQTLLDNFIPSFTTKRSRFPKWYSPSLRFFITKKNYHFRKHHLSGHHIHFNLGRVYRRMSKAQYKKDYVCYKTRVEKSIKSNVNCFWNHVNQVRGIDNDTPKLNFLNTIESDPAVLVNIFAGHFSSVFVQSSSFDPLSLPSAPSPNFIHIPRITTSDVTSAIRLLKPSKSSGNDNIPAFFVKACSIYLAPILEHIFNKSLDSLTFPSLWNSALIVPIYKSGNRSSVGNYRPISLCNIFCKVFERIVYSYLAPQIDRFLNPHQHGFRPARSTSTNLVSFLSYVGPSIVRGTQVDAVYFDFVKAFDRVDHGLLLSKLSSFNLDPLLILWFQSYLTTRTCSVRLGSQLSSYYSASSGVHQGSILGPLLFNIFVNDIGEILYDCSYELYADDLKISLPVETSNSCLKLQSSINRVSQWSVDNNMEIHCGKSLVISFTRCFSPVSYPYCFNGVALTRVSSVRDLGVILDSKLRFDDHFDALICKANQRLGLIRRISEDLSLECFILLFKTLVRPILEYAAPVWNVYGLTKSTMIENIQRSFVRVCYLRYMFRRVFYSYDSLCSRLTLETLFKRRKAHEVLFLINVLSGKTVCPQVQDQVVILPLGRRAGRPLYIRELSECCPLVRCVSSCNSLVNCPNLFSLSNLRSTFPYLE